MAAVPEERTTKPRCSLWTLKALTLVVRESVEDESIGLFVWSRGTRTGEFTQWASRVVLACLAESKQTDKKGTLA